MVFNLKKTDAKKIKKLEIKKYFKIKFLFINKKWSKSIKDSHFNPFHFYNTSSDICRIF